jgi:hypothetical protein
LGPERRALVRQAGELRCQRFELPFEALTLAMQCLAGGRGRRELFRRRARGVVALAELRSELGEFALYLFEGCPGLSLAGRGGGLGGSDLPFAQPQL